MANILFLLSKDLIQLIFIALVFAIPITYYSMQNWLENFAYHIDLQWWVFALAAFTAIAIALLTISFQSVKAALTNPVDSLRNE